MRKRVSEQLAEYGVAVTVEAFRNTLAQLKRELYPNLTDESLAFTRHEAERYCAAVREKVGGKRLPWVSFCSNWLI